MKEDYPNKIDQREVKGIVANKLCGTEYTYTHFNDCRIQGCPGHTARFDYYSTSEGYSMDFGDGTSITLDGTQIDLVNDWLERLKA